MTVCYDELAAEWPFIAVGRTLIVGTKRRIVIGFAVNSTCAALTFKQVSGPEVQAIIMG